MAIDDVVNDAPSNQTSPLERTAEKSDWSLTSIIKDTLIYSPIGIAAYLAVGPAALLTAAGLGIGKWLSNRKKKKKTSWKDMRRTLGVGMVGGVLAYAAYALPDYILGAPVSLVGRIAKTLLFNPILVTPWIAWYRTTSYITNKYGGWGLIKSLFNFKIFKYIKEAYNEDLKHKLLPTVLETFLTLAPIHFYSMNYLSNITARVGVGAGNDVLFSLISGEEGLLRTMKRKLIGEKKENKPGYNPTPEYAPAYNA